MNDCLFQDDEERIKYNLAIEEAYSERRPDIAEIANRHNLDVYKLAMQIENIDPYVLDHIEDLDELLDYAESVNQDDARGWGSYGEGTDHIADRLKQVHQTDNDKVSNWLIGQMCWYSSWEFNDIVRDQVVSDIYQLYFPGLTFEQVKRGEF